jgi:hypothetical protein
MREASKPIYSILLSLISKEFKFGKIWSNWYRILYQATDRTVKVDKLNKGLNNISSAKGFDGNLLDDKSRLYIFLFLSNILMWGSSAYLFVADWKEKSRNLTCSMDDE